MIILEILLAYTAGNMTFEEANENLKKINSFCYLNSDNKLTDDERSATIVGNEPSDANGYALLDVGDGSLKKIEIIDGKLVDGPINTVDENGSTGDNYAIVLIGGKYYEVKGDELFIK